CSRIAQALLHGVQRLDLRQEPCGELRPIRRFMELPADMSPAMRQVNAAPALLGQCAVRAISISLKCASKTLEELIRHMAAPRCAPLVEQLHSGVHVDPHVTQPTCAGMVGMQVAGWS